MAHDFYCTNCGRKLNQDQVLFDMQSLLVGGEVTDSNRLYLIPFRLTLAEFMALYNSGTQGDQGFRRCSLSLQQVLAYISNANNVNDPKVQTITVQEMKDYLGDADISAAQNPALSFGTAQAPKKKAASQEDAFYASFGLDDEDEEEEAAPVLVAPPKSAQEQTSQGIMALLKTDNKSVDDILFAKNRLRVELEKLYNLFRESETVSFSLHLYEETYDKDQRILTGYRIKLAGTEYKVDARVCPHCSAPIFELAGTAPHQSVAFIGYQSSGKTSTILALTHYVINAIKGSYDDKVWAGSNQISAVTNITILGMTTRLKEDLDNYGKGIAPPKTKADERNNAYSATFQVRCGNQYRLLTLIDLPGELCKYPGDGRGSLRTEIDEGKVLNKFQIALSADAYVVCFDTASAKEEQKQAEATGAAVESTASRINNVCTWADLFQSLRCNYNHTPNRIPMMVLFTKCEDLEGNVPEPASARRGSMQPIDQCYMFLQEKQTIMANPVYKGVVDRFSEVGSLPESFYAILRTSPFGYKAPSRTDLEENPSLTYHLPNPKNVDKLMRWLLSVPGCIPTECSYQRLLGDESSRITLDNYFIHRYQFRRENPDGESSHPNFSHEAMARCALFQNPGKWDKEDMEFIGTGKIHRMIMRGKRTANTNAEG